MKHVYLYTSKLSNAEVFRNDEEFEKVYMYDRINLDFAKTFENEYGRIKTKYAHYHIQIGTILIEGCPWCSHPTKFQKIKDAKNEFDKSEYCHVCANCGARGPVINVTPTAEANQLTMEHIEDFADQRFKERLPWDHNLKNPYES